MVKKVSARDYKRRLVMGKIKVVKKQLKAKLCGFQRTVLHGTEGLDQILDELGALRKKLRKMKGN